MEVKSNKKKYLIWTSSFQPRIGGLENATKEYACFMKKQGWRVQILTSRYPRSLPAQDYFDGLKVIRYQFLHSPLGFLKNGRLDLFFAWIFYKPLTIVKLIIHFFKARPDVVNLHFPDHQLLECYLLKLIFQFKLIISLHGNEVERMGKLKINSLRYYLYNKLFITAEYITGCSQFLLKEFQGIFPENNSGKCITVHNGVADIYIKQNIIENKDDQFFSAARFVPKKGLDLLFQSFKKETGFDLLIAGGIETELRDLGLEIKNGISIIGRLSPTEMVKQLSLSKITIIPSKNEPYGIIIAETICCGSPIVTTNVGGIPEVIDLAKKGLSKEEKKVFNKFVKLVKPEKDAIRIGINEIIKNYGCLDDYIKLIPNVRKQFHWSKRLDKFHDVLSEC